MTRANKELGRPPMTTEDKTFTLDEMADLLDRAATRLVERCRAVYCDPPPPSKYQFVVDAGAADRTGQLETEPLDARATARHLVGDDGSFRAWVNLSPVGIAHDATILEIQYADRFVRRRLTGKLAFPFEPLHLLGPSIPHDRNSEDADAKIALPVLSIRHGR